MPIQYLCTVLLALAFCASQAVAASAIPADVDAALARADAALPTPVRRILDSLASPGLFDEPAVADRPPQAIAQVARQRYLSAWNFVWQAAR